MILYHGTSSKRARTIMKDGLKSPYLTRDEDMACYYAEEAADEVGGMPVILKVNISDSDSAALMADFPSFEEPLSYTLKPLGLSEEEFHKWLDKGKLWPKNERDWKQSLKIVKTAWYDGTIPPKNVLGQKECGADQ